MTAPKTYLYKITDEPNHAASKIIAWIGVGPTVLEVGCASGVQTRQFKERLGCKVTGGELDRLAAEDARPYCEHLLNGSVEDLDLAQARGNGHFDAITFADVLEHLYEPADTLKKVRPLLKEGGHLIASIPNVTHAAICWELAHGRCDYQAYGLLDNTHIRFFTKKNVAKMFKDARYQIGSWDRVTKRPQETEFSVNCGSEQDQAFLEWIEKSNPEALTFQFIVKAQPVPADVPASDYRQLDAADTISKLEGEIGELTRQNMKLESQINWLENHRFGPVSQLINRLRNKTMNRN